MAGRRLQPPEFFYSMIQVLRETKEVPEELQGEVARYGGYNLFGKANFRVVWGWNRLTLVGGCWQDQDASGALLRRVREYRWIPKYLELNRWHVEKWMPPSFYGSPERWAETTYDHDDQFPLSLGPFPSAGEYEHCLTVQAPDGEFVDLTPEICRYIIRAVEYCRHLIPADRRKGIEQREAGKEKEEDGFADGVLEEAGPAFHGQPYIVKPSLTETLNFGLERSILNHA